MPQPLSPEAQRIMNERFHRDTLIALATAQDNAPSVRAVNAFYEDGSFYVITDARSNKLRHIRENPAVALCGDWFTARGVGEDLGHVLAGPNRSLAAKLREAFASWYGNGHTNESDPNTHILRVRLTHGVLLSHGTRYDIDFAATASIVDLCEHPELIDRAAAWFHQKWGIAEQAYLDSMREMLGAGAPVPKWYVAMDGERIVGGLGVIANDFHDRPDLTPNVCAVYVEEDCRRRGIAGRLLNHVCDAFAKMGVGTLYLLTDHTGFYERYGWTFHCMAQGDGEDEPARMYVKHTAVDA